eukprot:TRINITY_DN2384_c0_g1_i1.p1 TRINITY_DN2384_c0_g1~~TRINITY_DN2384_c0_g1_i1.p1  ORF type:complete len:216 (+),score=112.29 TRINITY_DN2384_c0_g1_i1:47-649(+)
MSKTGIAKNWKGPFGLVEMEDGTVVRIETGAIDGGRLRVGYTVSFDLKDDSKKPIGVNVTGPAVLPKGTVLSEEEQAEDKKKIEELKSKDKAQFEPVWEAVQALTTGNKLQLARELAKKLDTDIVFNRDKRMDKGNAFTKGEFLAFYGEKEGEKKWAAAKKFNGKKSGSKKKSKKGKKEDEKEGDAEAEAEEPAAEEKKE